MEDYEKTRKHLKDFLEVWLQPDQAALAIKFADEYAKEFAREEVYNAGVE